MIEISQPTTGYYVAHILNKHYSVMHFVVVHLFVYNKVIRAEWKVKINKMI